MRKLLLITIQLLLLSSCIMNKKEYGYEHDPSSFASLKINRSTKEEVLSAVGSPSTNSSLNDDTWYYITVKTQQVSLLKPEVTGHVVTQLDFKQDVLSDITIHDGKTKKSLKFNKGTSPIKGDETGVMKDFFFNLGRFNKEKGKKS